MMRSMYASVSGLKVHQTMMDVIGSNISNINTIGYKGSRTTFKEMLSQTIKGSSSPDDEQGKGGTNPQQIGLGVDLGSIDSDMGSGSLQPTGKNSDVAIQGDGFFVVNNGTEDFYTRAGSFAFDQEGYLYSSTSGHRVQGWIASEKGELGQMSPDTITDITLDKNMNPEATTDISYNGNLDAANENSLTATLNKINIGNGTSTDDIIIEMEDTEDFNKWKINLTARDTASTFTLSGTNALTAYLELDEEGKILSMTENLDGTGQDFLTTAPVINVGGTAINLNTPDANDDINSVDLIEGTATVEALNMEYDLSAKRTITVNVYDSQGKKHSVDIVMKKDDYNNWIIKEDDIEIENATEPAAGWLGGEDHRIVFDEEGNVIDGETITMDYYPFGDVGKHSMILDFSSITQFSGNMTADFKNVNGYPKGDFQSFAIDSDGTISGSFDNGQNKTLAKLSIARFTNSAGLKREGGLFKVSNNSGLPRVGEAGVDGRGILAPGSLEMSNVDMSKQFTNMITAQRGFQASSKLITTSDEMLQQLVNLKR